MSREGAANWPAWQALIWGQLVDKQYDHAFKRLAEFAGIVQQAEKPDEISETQRSTALWIGQILESVVRCDDSKKLRDLVDDPESRLREVLGEVLANSLEDGREVIRERENESAGGSDEAQGTLEQTRNRRKQEQAAALDKDLAGVKKSKESAAKTADEWKTWLDDALAKFDKQLDQLERSYRDLDKQATASMEAYTNTGRAVTAYSISPLPGMNLLELRNQMETYRMQYNLTAGRMSEVSQQAAQTVEQRTAAVDRYQEATGQIVQKNAQLDKWSSRMNDKKKKLVAKKPAAKTGPVDKPTPADKKQQRALRIFLPLDMEGQRDRLLDTFKSPEKAASDRTDAAGK